MHTVKAADALDKPEASDFSSSWLLFLLLLMPLAGGFGGGFDIDPDGIKAYMDAVNKKQDKVP